MRPRGPWQGRVATGEALVWLILARLAVRLVPFGHWRATLGRPPTFATEAPAEHLGSNLHARRLARAVERASLRLPGQTRCLPQAMALQWMLRLRGRDSVLHIGIAPCVDRGGIDGLHAWVTRRGEILIGMHDVAHVPVLSAENPAKRS